MPHVSRRLLLKGAAILVAGIFSLATLALAIQTNSTPPHRLKLKITTVRTAQLNVHGPQAHILLYTEQRMYGHGESTDAAAGRVSLVRSWRRMLVGQDPMNVEALRARFRVSGVFAEAPGRQYTTALTGVEIDLWDLAFCSKMSQSSRPLE